MKLGQIAQITIGTSDLENSYLFYKRLGFRKIAQGQHPFPWIKVTDNSQVLLLYENGDMYIALSYFAPDIAPIARKLQELGLSFVQNNVSEKVFITDDDLIITLSQGNPVKMINQSLQNVVNYPHLEAQPYPNSLLGVFCELSIPVNHLENARMFWETMEFETIQAANSPYPRLRMTDGISVIGLHETDNFDEFAISYRRHDLQTAVEQLFTNDIYTVSESLNGEENLHHLVIRTPENQLFYLLPEPVDKP